MPAKVFIHGVPDTPEIWSPLLEALDIAPSLENAPALPGFTRPVPAGFKSSKEDYVNWLIAHIKRVASQSGPVDLVAHDWGALLALRIVCLRPDLIRSWTIINAVPHPEDLWHSTARQWQTPIVGEIMMLLTSKNRLAAILQENGVPPELARQDTTFFGPDMKKSILSLYRSAKTLGTDWYPGFENLPPKGLILWGKDDRFGPVKIGRTFAERFDVPFTEIEKAGHWPFVQEPKMIADRLLKHWADAH